MIFDLVGIGQTGFTLIAMYCVNTTKFLKYGCLFGTASQPMWFIIAYRSGEVGLFITTSVITVLWLMGVWEHWIKGMFKKGEV